MRGLLGHLRWLGARPLQVLVLDFDGVAGSIEIS